MNKEELIKKWLDNSLTEEERLAFEQLEDFEKLQELDYNLKQLKTPEFNVEEGLLHLQKQLDSKANGMRWLSNVIRIAAVIVLGLSIFYYVVNLDTTIYTELAERTNIELPDGSTIELNSKSEIAYNKWFWNSRRSVTLDGEAYFKVAKGETFEVVTSEGTVAVLGTEFNVKERNGIFDVTCYEGKVSVSYKDSSVALKPGESFTIIDGKQIARKIKATSEPSWLAGESSFDSTPLRIVLEELQNQYDVTFKSKGLDTNRLFSGSFTNTDLDLALQSVCIPLNLTYSMSGNTILLKGE